MATNQNSLDQILDNISNSSKFQEFSRRPVTINLSLRDLHRLMTLETDQYMLFQLAQAYTKLYLSLETQE